MNKIKKWVLIILMSTVSYGIHAQSLFLDEPLRQDTAVTIGKLENGLTYYIRPNVRPEKKVELRLVVKAGSILENDNQQGLAHFMEHMEFNGLRHYPKNELVDYLQKIGVQFGADLNANTGWDRTYYLLPIPTDNPENLEHGFQIVADWAGGALINSEDVEDERSVILEELRMRNNNAQTRMMDQFFPVMLNGSRYAFRLPGGKDSIVRHADPERIREYYREWYRPDLMAVVVVGDVTVDKAESLIARYFGGLKKKVDAKSRTYYEVPPYTSKRAMVLTDAEETRYSFTLMFPAKRSLVEATVSDFRQELLENIFVQIVNRKLRDRVETSNPPFAEAGISMKGAIGGITQNNEGLELDVSPIKDVKTSVNAAIGVLLNVVHNGVTEADIQSVKNAYLAGYENAYNERNNAPSASYADIFADHFMKETPLVNIEDQYRYVREILPNIKAAEINALAKKVLHVPNTYFAMLTGPSIGQIALPSETELLKMVEQAFLQSSVQQEQKKQAAILLEKQPIAGKIVSEKKDMQLGTVTYMLSNGVKVTVKPTDFQKDEVLFRGIKYGGSNGYGRADKSNIAFLSAVIGSMGYGSFSPAELRDYLSGKNVQVGMGLASVDNEVSGRSSIKDLQTLLELNYLELTSPRKDTSLLKGWISKLETRLPLLKEDPQSAFNDSLTKYMYQNNPMTPMVIPTQKDIDQINVDRVLAIHQAEFGNADGFHFFLVGNVNPEGVKPLIEKYLASLPVKGTKPSYKDNGLRIVEGDKLFKFYKGSDTKSTVIDMYHGMLPYSSDLALHAEILAEIMTFRVIDTIREKMRAIYSGGVSANVSGFPYGHYEITAQMPCGPENVDAILNELQKEADTFKREGVSDVDLQKVKKALANEYRENIKENRTWASQLQQIFFWGSKKDDFISFEKRLEKVNAKNIKDTANKLLGSNHFKAASYPEQGK